MSPPDTTTDAVAATLERARRCLLAARTSAGHWEGALSSSALSTATASFALWLYAGQTSSTDGAPGHADCLRLSTGGARWLTTHQNADGGWGDTPDSLSNISTTALCWAALHAIGGSRAVQDALARAETWLTRAAGTLDAADLARAVAHRYGDDHTFSVPILTMCALAGRFGPVTHAWRRVPQLPFELAALPQSWFRFLHLPVVSYALPALIAIGQVRHEHQPTPNPLARLVRWAVRSRTQRVLERIQPPEGGFLEATPLTSFVVMSLVGSGEGHGPVAARGARFLARSVRTDGSWPIDTNLATWVTTLSVDALAAVQGLPDSLDARERGVIKAWLLAQQHRQRHPYTGADPGGWAWTDLAGGVPDADDTAGTLIALRNLGDADAVTLDAARTGSRWLLGLQNGDGGIPTFCRGWGRLPFDRSTPEITAHSLLAWSAWRDFLPGALADAVDRASRQALRCLQRQQRADGAWVPLWFGNQGAPNEENPTHGTARVVSALSRYRGHAELQARELAARGVRWLCAAQNADGGWGGAAGVSSSVEETGQALHALAAACTATSPASASPEPSSTLLSAIDRGAQWLVQTTCGGRKFTPAPIGLYFAKLWYAERLYPLIVTVAALASVMHVRSASHGAN